jgi:acetate---CoA ligase (ADP-forming)
MSLDALFRPRSVAIIGASNDANKVGGRPLAFLKTAGYAGRVLPVNPSAEQVQGVPAFATLAHIDGDIDQAIIAVPAAQVLATASACAERGVRALQIFSAGFGEGAGVEREMQQLLAQARRSGMRILGPNSLGLFNTATGFFGTFATALDGAWPQRGRVGVATQSGAFGSYFFGMAQARGLGFSHFVATGNELDVDVADCIAYLANDADTQIIVTAMEGVKDGPKFAAALRTAHAAGKPVLAMKVGVSAVGAQAAATHTGSLAGVDRVFDAVLRDCGAFRASSLDALVDAALVADLGPMPAGPQLLVVTTSGGIGVLVADACEAAGLSLPPISGAALRTIQQQVPLAAGHNPVDTSAGILADLGHYARIAEQALADRPFHAVLCYLAHITRNPAHWAQLREPLYALRQRYAGLHFVAVALADEATHADLRAHGFSVFSDPTRAVQALAANTPRDCVPLAAPDAAHSAAGSALWAGLFVSTAQPSEAQAKSALSAAGLQFAPERLVQDADQAAAAAHELGYPVVLKVVSPDIAHKTEAGGVQLNLRDEAALRAALPAMHSRVTAFAPLANLQGFLVAKQLSGGVEVLVGTQRDATFGPVITLGAGGVLTELLQDVQMALAPIDATQARAMFARTQVSRLCAGYRGSAPLDVDALCEQVARLSQVAWAQRARVTGIDLNPVLVLPAGAYALDALIAVEEGP